MSNQTFTLNKDIFTEEEAKSVVDKSYNGNISKKKREDLLSKVKDIRKYISAAPQDENTANLLLYLSEIEKDINGKKYGLIFEEHREDIDEVMDNYLPVLSEKTDLYINNGGQINFLIEGDNLASLKLLEKTHKEAIDLIYIDPPYNTGNEDFIYCDQYVATDDAFRHSKWLSFMEKRLKISKKLLSPDGAIFIQINDIEVAQLKELCDEIFGENNFLNIVSIKMKNIAGASGGGEDKKLKKNCEYLLIYAKSYEFLNTFSAVYDYEEISDMVGRYKNEGISWKYTSVLTYEGEKNYIGSTVDGDGNEIRIFSRDNYVIKSISQITKEENLTEKEAYDKYASKIFTTAMPQSSIRPRVMEKVKEIGFKNDLYSIEYVPKTGKNKGKVYEQFYKGEKFRLFAWLKDVTETIDGKLYKKTMQGTYWDMVSGINNLTKEGNVVFGNGKKPLILLERVISMHPNKNATVLDFFAGSGTTGHAVIEQNKKDGGQRRFILCTNNESNICLDKTYKRLYNVINGYTTDKGKSFPSNIASLKYYTIKYLPISDRLYYEYADELLKYVRELVELENGINFNGNTEIGIVLTDEELEEFVSSNEKLTTCKKLYMGHDILPKSEQQEKLKENKIEVNIIPNYYYSDLEEA